MPLLPDKSHLKLIEDECLRLFESGEKIGAIELADALMKLDGLPVHCPYHHFLVPAAILTSAHMYACSNIESLAADLRKAGARSGDIPGGICGLCGNCGAATGAGIFASIWQKTTSMSKSGWAVCNELTARSLSEIASVEGPRCCKRVSYLSLRAAVPAINELLDVYVGEATEIKCSFHTKSRECRKGACPFYPGE